MRLLVAAPFLISPHATHGGGVYLGCLTEALAAEVTVDVVAFATPSELAEAPPPPRGIAELRVVVRPARRDLRGIAALRDRIRHTVRWAAGTPLLVSKFQSTAMARTLRATVAEFRPDACLIEMGWMAQYLPAVAPVPAVLTDHEAGIPAAGPQGAARRRDRRLWQRYIARTYPHAARLQAVNVDDARALARLLDRDVGVRAIAVPWPTMAAEPASAPRRLVFLGDYRHPPNPESARFVATQVLPRIRPLVPDAELWLAGPHADVSGVEALGSLPGVRVLGRVEDPSALLASARAMVAPVFHGGGSRVKVLTALACGLPVVSNALGLRGVSAAPPAVAVAEDAEGQAAACVSWLTDDSAVAAAGLAARDWARDHASPQAAARAQLAILRELLAARAVSGR